MAIKTARLVERGVPECLTPPVNSSNWWSTFFSLVRASRPYQAVASFLNLLYWIGVICLWVVVTYPIGYLCYYSGYNAGWQDVMDVCGDMTPAKRFWLGWNGFFGAVMVLELSPAAILGILVSIVALRTLFAAHDVKEAVSSAIVEPAPKPESLLLKKPFTRVTVEPTCQGRIAYIAQDGTVDFEGTFFRVGSLAVTAAHNIGDYINETVKVRLSRETNAGPVSVDTYLDKTTVYTVPDYSDVAWFQLPMDAWARLQIRSGTLRPADQQPSGVATITVKGRSSIGKLEESAAYPEMTFDGSTDDGFSGAPYIGNDNRIAAVHTAGGISVNFAQSTVPLALWILNEERERKAEFERRKQESSPPNLLAKRKAKAAGWRPREGQPLMFNDTLYNTDKPGMKSLIEAWNKRGRDRKEAHNIISRLPGNVDFVDYDPGQNQFWLESLKYRWNKNDEVRVVDTSDPDDDTEDEHPYATLPLTKSEYEEMVRDLHPTLKRRLETTKPLGRFNESLNSTRGSLPPQEEGRVQEKKKRRKAEIPAPTLVFNLEKRLMQLEAELTSLKENPVTLCAGKA